MKHPVVILTIILLCTGLVLGVDTKAIDEVRAKAAFSDSDAATIDKFIDTVVKEMLERTEFTNVSQTREAFTSRITLDKPDPKYTELWTAASEKHFKAGLIDAGKLADAEKKKNVKMNLLIMLDKVGQAGTAKMAMEHISDADAGVRYWAVRCVANPAVLAQLNSSGEENAKVVRDIASRLKTMAAAETNPEVVECAVDFGAAFNTTEATDLLLAIADKRIKEYENWTVNYELLDGKLLDGLCKKAKGNKAVASAFGQLLSDCMQKYMKHLASPSQSPLLGEQQAGYLATALATTEKGCLSDLLGAGRSAIQNAITKGASGAGAINGEYASLFGVNGGTGELTKALGMKYTDAQGKEQPMPRGLPDKPGMAAANK
jgi:hypothetical protein